MVKRESAKNDFYIIYSWLTKLVYSVVNFKKSKSTWSTKQIFQEIATIQTISNNFFLVNQGGYKSYKANLILKGRFNMKLECFFYNLKEIAAYHVHGTYETVYIYEYIVKRPWNLSDRELILYMVAKANKDNFAKNDDIKKGFFTLGQAFDFARNKYNIERTKLG